MLGQLTPGTQVAGYEIERPLGRGGMGEVYLARKHGERRSVALKLLSSGLTADERFQERFERESHMATSLEHPHIVPVYAIGEIEGVRFIAMRYIDGPTLRDLVERESPLDVRRVAAILGQVASALDDAHEIGLVHRDIKPANILIARSGASEYREHAYLTDFGVSKYTGSDSGFTGTGQFVGTSLYGSPEQIRGEPIDGRADVYAFGCVLFECLIGRPPFERDNEAALLWAQMFEQAPAVSGLRADLDPAFDEVVANAMAKSRGDRYPTCGAVVVALRGAIATLPPAAGTPAVAAPVVTVEALKEAEPPPAPETVLKAAPTVLQPEPLEEPAPEPEPPGPPEDEVSEDDQREAADDMTAPELVPAQEDASAAPETVLRPAAAAAAASSAAAASPLPPEPLPTPPAAETIAVPETPDTEVGSSARPASAPTPGPVPDPVPSAAQLTVIEDRVTTTPGVDDGRRRRLSPALVAGSLLALVVVGAGAYWLTRDDASSPPVPASTALPKITGAPRAGETLRATQGAWSGEPTTYAYAWRRCNAGGGKCTAISGADTRMRALTEADVGSRLRFAVTASNDGGERTTVSKPTALVAAALVRPSATDAPTVSGTTQEGSTLRVQPGAWKGTKPLSRSYVWLRCHDGGGDCTAVAGARGTSYTLTAADVEHRLRVEERVRNEAGAAVARSAASSPVTARPTQPQPPPSPPTSPSPPPPPPPTTTTTCPPVCPTD